MRSTFEEDEPSQPHFTSPDVSKRPDLYNEVNQSEDYRRG